MTHTRLDRLITESGIEVPTELDTAKKRARWLFDVDHQLAENDCRYVRAIALEGHEDDEPA